MTQTPWQRSGVPGQRPRAVTLGGLQAVAGSALALVLLVSTAQQLNGQEMSAALAKAVDTEQAVAVGLTLETARTLLRYTLMAMGVLSVTSLVLGFYVLRRHRPSRIGLTIIGGLVGGLALVAGPVGWLVTAYIAVSLFLLWSRPARVWFAEPGTTPATRPPSPPPPR